jgi:hypothetical protein
LNETLNKKKKMNHKPAKSKPHEDPDGMVKTKGAIILIYL